MTTELPNRLLPALMRGAPYQPATNYWRAIEIAAVIEHGLPAGRGLDLGCGDGKLTQVILDEGKSARPTLVGIDLDPAETRLAVQSGIYAQVHTCSATEIPEPDASFDFVFSNSVLEHIGPIEGVLDEVQRLLKPGGKFIFTVPGPDFHKCLKGGPLGSGTSAAYLEEIDQRCAHLRYWDESRWAAELTSRGMQVRHSAPYLSRRQTQRWESLSAMTGGLLYRLHGKKARPIEIQRKFNMRRERNGAIGALMSAASPILTLGAPLDLAETSAAYGCLLIEAVRD